MSEPSTKIAGIVRFRVPDELHERLRAYAAAQDLSLAGAVRRLVQAGIRQRQTEDRLLAIALATLIACEQTLLVLESFIPDGKSRSTRLRESAIRAAQIRLAQVATTEDEG